MLLNHLSIGKGVKGTKAAVDAIRLEFDQKLKHWKSSIEAEMLASAQVRPQTRSLTIRRPTGMARSYACVGFVCLISCMQHCSRVNCKCPCTYKVKVLSYF